MKLMFCEAGWQYLWGDVLWNLVIAMRWENARLAERRAIKVGGFRHCQFGHGNQHQFSVQQFTHLCGNSFPKDGPSISSALAQLPAVCGVHRGPSAGFHRAMFKKVKHPDFIVGHRLKGANAKRDPLLDEKMGSNKRSRDEDGSSSVVYKETPEEKKARLKLWILEGCPLSTLCPKKEHINLQEKSKHIIEPDW